MEKIGGAMGATLFCAGSLFLAYMTGESLSDLMEISDASMRYIIDSLVAYPYLLGGGIIGYAAGSKLEEIIKR